MSPLKVRDLTVAYRDKPAIWDIDWDVNPGTVTAIVGPNGAGKSTLLKACLGLVPVVTGTVSFFDKPLSLVRNRIAYVPQRSTVDWDFPADVADVVMMGTYGRLGWFKRPGRRERNEAMEALEMVGMANLGHRQISELSGGQQQRVFVARALVQQAELIFLDEPFAGVDAVTESAIVELMHRLRSTGITFVAVHHDLETLAAYFDEVLLLNVNKVASVSTKDLSPELIRATYGTRNRA